jgi:chemotaxis protein methyltransferase CheR
MTIGSRRDSIYVGDQFNEENSGITRQVLRFLKRDIIYDLALYPYGRYKHRNLRGSAAMNDHHTFTAFYRSPGQVQALIGPVYEYLASNGCANKIVINVFAGSRGAEAYTMASALLRTYPDLDFEVHCSDLHEEVVEEARAGIFTLEQITQGQVVPKQFIEETFDPVGENFSVKAAIRERVSFSCSDILNDKLTEKYPPGDVICAQNVFCHMSDNDAERGFLNVLTLAKEKSAIFIDGMSPDLRIKLTLANELEPLEFQHKNIYKQTRKLLSPSWWKYYYGREPYLSFKRDKVRRYSTIFFRGKSFET